MEGQVGVTDDGYMNEKHMGAVERSLLSISESRRKLRVACDELTADSAEQHLVDALTQADRDLELAYKKLFQGTYFHVSDEQLANAGKSRAASEADAPVAQRSKKLDIPEPAEELRLFKGDEAADRAKK